MGTITIFTILHVSTVTIFTILDLVETVAIFTILVAWHRNHGWFGNLYFSVVGLIFASDFGVDSDVRVDSEEVESRYTILLACGLCVTAIYALSLSTTSGKPSQV